jgi:hypothetical protein
VEKTNFLQKSPGTAGEKLTFFRAILIPFGGPSHEPFGGPPTLKITLKMTVFTPFLALLEWDDFPVKKGPFLDP